MGKVNIKEIKKKCNELRRSGNNPFDLTINLLELVLAPNTDNQQKVDAAKEIIEVLGSTATTKAKAVCSYAYRCLAETYAQAEDKELALRYVTLFRQTAKESQSHSQIQLSYHVSAWIYEKLWVVSNSSKTDDLQEAYNYGIAALQYLEAHSNEIKRDRDPNRGDLPDVRKAELERFMAGIAGNLHKKNEAERFLRSSLNYAKKHGLSDLKYNLYLTQLDFEWVDKKRVAQILVNEAHAKRKSGAKLELAQVLIYEGLMDRAFNILVEILGSHKHELTTEDRGFLDCRLVFTFKFIQASRKFQTLTTSSKEKRQLAEKMGDLILEYSSTHRETLKQAIKYYGEMLKYSTTDLEKIPALLSLGQTWVDLKEYSSALRYFKECLKCEENIMRSPEQTLSTRILIFNTECQLDSNNKTSMIDKFDALLKCIPSWKALTKRNMYNKMAMFLEKLGDPDAAYYSSKAKQLQGTRGDESDDEDSEEHDVGQSSCDELSQMEILRICEKKAKHMNDVENLEKRKSWKNNHGETDLHMEAKGSNTGRLVMLIKHGYSVNAQDNSGWTPLHEAINHQKLDNVKILIQNGARLDLASNGGDDGSLEEGRIGGKITPLMDACANLNEGEEMVKIAELIYQRAVNSSVDSITLKNEDGWTAIDFIVDSVKRMEEEGDTDNLPRIKKLLETMKQFCRKKGIETRASPPPLKQRKSLNESLSEKRPHTRRVEGVTDYMNAMLKIGGRANVSTVPAIKQELQFAETPEDNFEDPQFFDPFSNEEDIVPKSSNAFPDATDSPEFKANRKNFNRPRRSTEFDNFMEQDEEEVIVRKRKNRDLSTQQSKRRTGPEHSNRDDFNIPEEQFVEPDSFETPISRLIKRSESFLDSGLPTTPAPTRPKITANVSFFDSTGAQIRANLLVAFDSTSKVDAVREKCSKTLSSHQKTFKICLEDGTEVDSDLDLFLLKVSESEPVKFKCVVELATPETLFRSFKQENGCEKEVIAKLQQLSSNQSQLDLSKIEADHCLQSIFHSIFESHKTIRALNINLNDLRNLNIQNICEIFKACEQLKACSSNISDVMVEQMVAAGATFEKITELDLSFNLISSDGLSSFLGLTPSVSHLTIQGLNLMNAPCNFAETFSGRHNLTHLNLRYSKINPGALEQLFNECHSIASLDLGGSDIPFTFTASWLPALRELRLAKSIIHRWDSFIDWIGMGGVEKVDLSLTSVTADHVLSLCELRPDKKIIIRLIRCLPLELGLETLTSGLVRLLENGRPCPVRLQLPVDVSAAIRRETQLSNILIV